MNLVFRPLGLSLSQAAQLESQFNPHTGAIWVNVAIITKATCGYSFIVLWTLRGLSEVSGGGLELLGNNQFRAAPRVKLSWRGKVL